MKSRVINKTEERVLFYGLSEGEELQLTAILRGLSEYGAAIHKIGEGFDTGDLLAVVRFPICEDETTRSLIGKTKTAALPMLDRVFADLLRYDAAATPQSGGEYWHLPTEAELTVTEATDPVTADRIRRAKEE